ncbi:MAG: DUF4838 domain-containing protein [Eubacteriales bacterium]
MRMIVSKTGKNKTVGFASEEFVRYLKLIDNSIMIDERVYDTYETLNEDIIWIGQYSPFVAPNEYDDEILVEIKDGAGVITGSNPRAVLIAVYRTLYELGCRFTSPEDEYIPKKDITPVSLNISVNETASYRHRSVCIEGAVSYSHVFNMIDWLPKAGMDGYFVQFRIPFTFFDRFYSAHNMPLDENGVTHMYHRLVEEMTKRGLMYHATGHGWTCEPFGITGSGWFPNKEPLSPDIKQYLAEVNGKRELWGDVALNTNLCYSNREVRKKIASAIKDYCAEYQAIEYLHFWLADGSNNHCECENCHNTKPSDFYIMMLNEIDAALTAAKINTKVVFLIYVDLLWEPDFARIINSERFVLMFAPITRTYTTAFCEGISSETPELTPYVRNKLKMPRSVDENIARLKKWQEQFNGDSFDFDYHLMWDHVNDPGYTECARILYEDVINFDKIGINGMVSCQLQRTGFPTWLPLYAMAKGLWNKKITFNEITDEYYKALFGDCGDIIKNYLTRLTELFNPAYLRAELEQINNETASRYAAIPAYIADIKPFLISKAKCGRQWEKLLIHADLCIILAEGLAARASGDSETAKYKYNDLIRTAYANEAITMDSLDMWNYENIMRRVLCS